MIHINRDRQNLGQFTPEDVSAGLHTGRFLPTDLAWREGMETWQPLATFSDLPAPDAVVPPTLAPGTEEVLPPIIEAGPPVPEWERRDEVGYFRAALVTIRQVFTNPIGTFRRMPKTGGFLGPLIYCYVLQTVCALVGLTESLVWVRVLPKNLLAHLGENPEQTVVGNLAFTLPLMLVGGLIFPFLFGGLYYLMLRLVTKKPASYETVFRTYCYMMGSASIVNLLPMPPLVGVQVVFMVFVVIVAFTYLVVAIREATEITTLESVAVVVLPMLLCCFCFAAAMGGVFALVGSVPALQGMGGH
jgi:hypothetical protein